MLPIRTTVDDIETICAYLLTKPTGATSTEARAVLSSKVLDGRKTTAFKYWGLIEDEGGRMKLTEKGRQAGKEKGAYRFKALRDVIRNVAPYSAIVERAVHSKEFTAPATDVAAHWYNHFKDEAAPSDKILNDQALCFFQIAQGADLGKLVVGRKGQSTRFDFDPDAVTDFIENSEGKFSDIVDQTQDGFEEESHIKNLDEQNYEDGSKTEVKKPKDNRVFITHGSNAVILEQVKKLVTYGKFKPVVAKENETNAKSITDKVMDDMRGCQAAVIHVGAEGVLYDKDGKQQTQINHNVLIEIGAALALYDRNFILLVEEGVQLPSNIKGLYECRYKGEELGMDATMKILEAFNSFK